MLHNKDYPYLQDSYFYSVDDEYQKRTVLEDIDDFVNQKQYIKMTLLNWKEEPLKEIEGIISSGSLSKNASAPVRRSANLSCSVDTRSYNVDNASEDFAINKKIFIEIGILNQTEHYPDFPIFWFPQGIFFIGSFSMNASSSSAVNISLTLKDKMALLNGDVGGKLPALVTFDSQDTQLPNGQIATKKTPIYQIIQELVNHFGGEGLNNIIIEDVPLRIRRVVKWNGEDDLYLKIYTGDISNLDRNSDASTIFTLEKPAEKPFYTFHRGDDIGYVRDDFVIQSNLVGNAGETVVSILDKIKNILGNYEYYYDVFGVFHFREIKNYLNTTKGEIVLEEMAEKDYLIESNNSLSNFTFTDQELLTSITVTPQYENIKNDFIVLGIDESENVSKEIRYHLAIDKKPRPIGVDSRATISRIVDRTLDIEKIKADITKLNAQLNIAKQEKISTQSRLENYKRNKNNFLAKSRKYGDLFKRELSLLLGESWSLPIGQELKKVTISQKNFYTFEDFVKVYYYCKEGNQEVDSAILDNLVKQTIEDSQKIGDFPSSFKATWIFNQIFYDALTPESYWKIICSNRLQNLFNKEKEEKYQNSLSQWKDALYKWYQDEKNKDVIYGYTSSTVGAEVTTETKAETDGYKPYAIDSQTTLYTNENVAIKSNNKEWIYVPKEPDKPHFLNDNEKQNITEDSEDYIKTIVDLFYSPFSSNYIEKQKKDNNEDNKNNVKNNQLTDLISKKEAAVTLLGTLRSKLEKSPNSDGYIQIEIGGQNKLYSYTDLEGLIQDQENLIKEYQNNIDNFEKFLERNDNNYNATITHWKESLKEYCKLYFDAKKKISDYNDKINNIALEGYYHYISIDIDSNISFDELKDILFNNNKNLLLDSKNVKLSSQDDDTIEKYLLDNSPIKNAFELENISKIKFWEQLIQLMEECLKTIEKNQETETVSNPHLGEKIYDNSFYQDKILVAYEEMDTHLIKLGFVEKIKEDGSLPYTGNVNIIYFWNNNYYYWDGTAYQSLLIKQVYNNTELSNSYYIYDWRTYLYLEGLYNSYFGIDYNYYFEELEAYWPRTYDLINQVFYTSNNEKYDKEFQDQDGTTKTVYNYNLAPYANGPYMLDFLDSVSGRFAEWSVDNIGRRTDVLNDKDVNCLITPEIPNLNILNNVHQGTTNDEEPSGTSDYIRYLVEQEQSLASLKEESAKNNEPFTQVSDDIFQNILTGGMRKGALEQIRSELFLHTRYQKSISMTAIPVFYLEPNSRVTILDETTQTFGDFIISNISITFGPGANMSVAASEALVKM